MKKTLALTICVLFLGSTALADWYPGQPVKWDHVQLPDLSPTGMDVMMGNYPPGASVVKVLADDFECTTPGLVRDIHIWGSWKDDNLPLDAAGAEEVDGMVFHMKIMSDIPAPAGGQGYSMPGDVLWEGAFGPGQFMVKEEGFGPEDWYDPNAEEWLNDNHGRAFQYNFDIPEADAFMQQGTPNNPIVYWLAIDVMPFGNQAQEPPVFGWKTTHPQNNWNDDATFSDWVWDPGVGEMVMIKPWDDMVYPRDPTGFPHEFVDQSINLAFVITPEPTTMVLLGMGAVALILRRRR